MLIIAQDWRKSQMEFFNNLYCVDLAALIIIWFVLTAITALIIEWFEKRIKAKAKKAHKFQIRQYQGEINRLEKENEWLRKYIKDLENAKN